MKYYRYKFVLFSPIYRLGIFEIGPGKLATEHSCINAPDRTASLAQATEACGRGGTICRPLFGAAPRGMSCNTRGRTAAAGSGRGAKRVGKKIRRTKNINYTRNSHRSIVGD